MMCEFTEDSMTLRQRLAEVEVIGPFACGQIKLSWSDEPRPTSPRLESEIDRVWNSEHASAQQAGAVLFNGDLVRLVDHHSVGSTLHIDVGPTDYKSFLGTNLRNGHRVDSIGKESFANAIGVSAIIVTQEPRYDERSVILGLRSRNVVDQPGWFHTFGGALEAGDRNSGGSIDVFAAVMRELCEELSIESSDVIRLSCLGLVRDRQTHQPELLFEAYLGLAGEEIRSGLDYEAPEAEHEDLKLIADTQESLADFILESARVTPVALAAIYLHGCSHFCAGWFNR